MSAGGHTIAFAAFSAFFDDDTTSYDGQVSNMGGNTGRRPNRPYTRAQFSYEFDFDGSGNYPPEDMPDIAGLFLWEAPIDVYVASTTGPEQTAVRAGRNVHMGRSFNSGNPGEARNELDLNHYIDGGTASSDYDTAGNDFTASPPDFPIGYVEMTDGVASISSPADDGILTDDAGVDALYDILDTMGYDVSKAVIETTDTSPTTDDMSTSGLTRFQRLPNHDEMDSGPYTDDLAQDFITWLEAVDTTETTVTPQGLAVATDFPSEVWGQDVPAETTDRQYAVPGHQPGRWRHHIARGLGGHRRLPDRNPSQRCCRSARFARGHRRVPGVHHRQR